MEKLHFFMLQETTTAKSYQEKGADTSRYAEWEDDGECSVIVSLAHWLESC